MSSHPGPETELLAGWAIEQHQAMRRRRWSTSAPAPAPSPRRLADEVPHARVHAVELDEAAHRFAARNLAGTGVDLRLGDAFTAFDDLAGTVDVVVCNPPYVPLEAWESVAPEARDHDPHLALFSGADGLDAIRLLAVRAAVLLRPGGVLGVEHADVQGDVACRPSSRPPAAGPRCATTATSRAVLGSPPPDWHHDPS